MAFEQKTWTDRVAEFINRRVLTKEDGSTELVTVARSEGTISQEGDAFNAKNMNDLEQRVADEFGALNDTLTNQSKQIVALDNLKSYSTEETVIGTWINGKPIYRKFIYTNQDLNSITDVSALNIETFIKIDGFGKYSSNNATLPIYYRDTDNYCAVWYDATNKLIKAIGSKTLENAYIWLEYTKTTD